MSLRVACVGAGYFSRFHYDSWARIEPVEVVGACDVDLARAQATGLPAFADLNEMLEQTRPDVLDVILPPIAQAVCIRSAIAHGVTTIICQKPFCQSLEEARQICDEAKAAGVTIIVHENFRFQPWYRRIKSALEANMIGELQQITFRLRPGDGQGAKAYLDRQPYFQTMPRFLVHETAVHWIDTFRYLAGEVHAVYADLRRVNPVISGEDAGMILFDLDNDVRAVFDGNRCLDHVAENHRNTMGEAMIEGSKGTLNLGGDGAVAFRAFGKVKTQTLLKAQAHKNFGGDCVHHLQSHVVAALLDGALLENEAHAYLRIIEIEEAIYASADQGRKIAL